MSVTRADGSVGVYAFALSKMEERFLQGGGVERLYKAFRKELFKAVLKGPDGTAEWAAQGAGCGEDGADCGTGSSAKKALSW